MLKAPFLANKCPKLRCEWDVENTKLFDEVTCGSEYRAKWICYYCGKKWESTVYVRSGHTDNIGCGRCKNIITRQSSSDNLSSKFPEICNYWHAKNNRSPSEFGASSNLKVWWYCSCCNDEFLATISHITMRAKKVTCKKCSRKQFNLWWATPLQNQSLLDLNPQVCKDWDYDKNDKTPSDYKKNSRTRIWWRCHICNFSWETTIDKRSNGRNCPACSNKALSDKNRLSIVRSDVAKEWCYELNNGITPNDVSYASNKKFYFKCKKRGHIWYGMVNTRSSTYRCPKCWESSGEKRISLYLEKIHCYFQPQFSFNDCLSTKGRKLRFDFAVFVNDKMFLIEYQGIQHFEKLACMSDEQFIQSRIRDDIKLQYCMQNKIPLLIITKHYIKYIEQIINEIIEDLQ